MDWARAGAIFERSSFTRLGLLATAGTWLQPARAEADSAA
jgi:hypothetical protein